VACHLKPWKNSRIATWREFPFASSFIYLLIFLLHASSLPSAAPSPRPPPPSSSCSEGPLFQPLGRVLRQLPVVPEGHVFQRPQWSRVVHPVRPWFFSEVHRVLELRRLPRRALHELHGGRRRVRRVPARPIDERRNGARSVPAMLGLEHACGGRLRPDHGLREQNAMWASRRRLLFPGPNWRSHMRRLPE
jgi:hypothetical protein